MTLNRQTLAKIDKQVLSQMNHGEGCSWSRCRCQMRCGRPGAGIAMRSVYRWVGPASQWMPWAAGVSWGTTKVGGIKHLEPKSQTDRPPRSLFRRCRCFADVVVPKMAGLPGRPIRKASHCGDSRLWACRESNPVLGIKSPLLCRLSYRPDIAHYCWVFG